MKLYEDITSMTYYKEKLFLPYNQSSRMKTRMIYMLNTPIESIGTLLNDDHPIIKNIGIYKTYYYDYNSLPKAIKSKRVRNSGLVPAVAKKDRLTYYSQVKQSCDSVNTPLVLGSNHANFIWDMNPLMDLYNKQKKLTTMPLRESIVTFFDTIDAYTNRQIPGYTSGGIFVDLDSYSAKTAKNHVLTHLMLMLRRTESFISEHPYSFRILFYTGYGYFLFDASTDLKKTNYGLLKRLLKRLRPDGFSNVEDTVDSIEKKEVQRYLASKAAMSSNFTGDDDSIPTEDDIDPDDLIDPDSSIVDKVSNKIDTVDDLEDDKTMAELDDELAHNDELKKEFEDAISRKSTGKTKSAASLKRDELLRSKQKDIKLKTKTLGELAAEKQIPVVPVHKIESDTITNENMKDMKFPEFNKTYMEGLYEKDVASMITALTDEDKSIPVHVIDIKVEDTSDEMSLKETYRVTLEDENRRRHVLKFALPKVIDNEFIYINGSKKTIQNQFFMFPVIKTQTDTVQICTNYNKIFITRVGSKFSQSSEKFRKLMEAYPGKITYRKGCNLSGNNDKMTCLEYDEFAKTYNEIHIGKAVFDFNAVRLHEKFPDFKENLDSYLVGYVGNKPIIYDTKSSEYADLISLMVSFCDDDQMIDDFKHYSTGKKFVHTKATLMAKKIPTVVVISYFEGLTKVIQKFNDNTVRYTDKASDKENKMYIKFKDGFLEYPKSNMEAAMLFNGLTEFNTSEYTIAEMDIRTTYVDIFDILTGGGISIADALLNYYDWMIDPITYQVLEMLNYPTDIVSLMIFASNMLADAHFKTDMDLNQYRLRSMEVIPAILYKNIARSYSRYRRTANNPNPVKITMDENAVIKELVALPTVEGYSELSPMVEMHRQGLVSMKGANGLNLDRAYKLDKRAYDDSMAGVIGISTDPGPNCGKIKQLVAEPTIINARGFMDLNNRKNMSELKDVNLSNPVELLTAMTATHDDPNRVAYATKQTCHVVPVTENCPGLISTGMDQMVHYRTGNDFSVVAKNDGKVLTIDKESELMIVQYKDGSKQAIDLSTRVVKNGGGGFYLDNKLVPKVKSGQTFKKDALLAYDPKYYKEQDVLGNRLTMGSLQKVVVMSNYATYEDSNLITKKMSEDLGTDVTMQHRLILGKNANVDYIVKVGDHVTVGDDLIRYETSYDDSELNRMLSSIRDDMKEEIVNLGRSQLHSHYTGVVTDVEIITTVPTDELSPSLKKIVNTYQKKIKNRKKLLDEYEPESKGSVYRMGMMMTKSDGVTKADEYGKVQGEDIGEGVRFIIYVTYHDELSDGDKLSAWTANKNTIGYQIPEGFEPFSETRPYEEIATTIAPSAILQRGTPSVVTTACGYKVLIELKRKMYEILTGENFDEVLKQKQPHMNHDSSPLREQEELPIVSSDQIYLMEMTSDLYKDGSNKYRSQKYYSEQDIILPISESLDMSPMIENFQIVNSGHNAIMNDDMIIAIEPIEPNTPIRLKL